VAQKYEIFVKILQKKSKLLN